MESELLFPPRSSNLESWVVATALQSGKHRQVLNSIEISFAALELVGLAQTNPPLTKVERLMAQEVLRLVMGKAIFPSMR